MKVITSLFLGVALVMSGCGHIRTSSTAFHGPSHEERGTIAPLPLNDDQRGSLAFGAVADYVSKKLGEKGYTPVADASSAAYVYSVTYGVDGGRTKLRPVPIFGQTGGGTSYTTGNINSGGNFGSFNATTTTTPTYGVVGSTVASSREFTRTVNIDIYRKTSGGLEKAYEVRANSVGTCGDINTVLFGIIDGIFKEFPGQNGKATAVNVPWDGKC